MCTCIFSNLTSVYTPCIETWGLGAVVLSVTKKKQATVFHIPLGRTLMYFFFKYENTKGLEWGRGGHNGGQSVN